MPSRSPNASASPLASWKEAVVRSRPRTHDLAKGYGLVDLMARQANQAWKWTYRP